ncbi:MAG: glycosyltransferase family 39 protein [Verrucomicrobiota bacterium]
MKQHGFNLARLNPKKQKSRKSNPQVLREDTPAYRVNGNGAHRKLQKQVSPAIILVLCLALFTVKALTSLVQESSTWDETGYFGLGKYILQNHRWDVPGSILHPPLSYYIHSIPLLFFPSDPDLWRNDPSRAKDPEYLGSGGLVRVVRGQALFSSSANQGDRLLDLSRLMMVLTAVLLGWFVYLWSYSLYGKRSAILAVVLYSFCPNILAYARLITPDITLTTFSFITLYYFWRLLRDGQIGDVVLGGICLGLALLSKFTSIILLPICFALMILWRGKQKTTNLRNYLIFAIIGVGILLLGYGMNLEPYFAGILYQQKHANPGSPGFLMGQHSNNGWWYYFIVAFLIKTPIVTMIFLTISLVLFIGKIPKGEWLDEAFLLMPATVIFCFFSLNHQAIGLRYILPIYPFLFVFASKAAQFFLSNKMLIKLYIAAITWYIGASCYIHPHYLAYFNELVGGPNNGYKYLVDSNLDWGQDLKGLKKYMQKHAISRINLSYFGTDSPERYGITYNWLPSYVLRDLNPEYHEFPLKGWVAISATNLQGDYFADKNLFAWFRGRKPVAKIGYSIFIYNMDD